MSKVIYDMCGQLTPKRPIDACSLPHQGLLKVSSKTNVDCPQNGKVKVTECWECQHFDKMVSLQTVRCLYGFSTQRLNLAKIKLVDARKKSERRCSVCKRKLKKDDFKYCSDKCRDFVKEANMPRKYLSQENALKMFLDLEPPAEINAKEWGEKAGYTMTEVGSSGLLNLMRKLKCNNAMDFERDAENVNLCMIARMDKTTISDILAGKVSAQSCQGMLPMPKPETEVEIEETAKVSEESAPQQAGFVTADNHSAFEETIEPETEEKVEEAPEVKEEVTEAEEEEKVEEVKDTELIPYIEGHAQLIRNQRVMLDRDLATVYGVETRVLNQQRERNPTKFPEDFAFKLNDTETDNWLSQNVIPKDKLGGHNPWGYTLEGCRVHDKLQ